MGGGGLYMWFYRIQLFSYLFPPRVAKLHKIKNILNDACRSMGKVSMTFKLFFWCFGLGSTVFNVAVFWNSCLSFVIVPMQDDSQCDCRNACNLIKAANRWDLLKIHHTISHPLEIRDRNWKWWHNWWHCREMPDLLDLSNQALVYKSRKVRETNMEEVIIINWTSKDHASNDNGDGSRSWVSRLRCGFPTWDHWRGDQGSRYHHW